MARLPSDPDALAYELHKHVHGPVLGPGLSPWGTVQEQAAILLDFVEQGGYHARAPKGASDAQVEAWRARDAAISNGPEVRQRIRLLVRIAFRQWAETWPRAKARWGGWSQHGLVFSRYGGEKHVLCNYCRVELATLDGGSHRLTQEWVDRREMHTIPCALRGLVNSEHWRGPVVARRKVR